MRVFISIICFTFALMSLSDVIINDIEPVINGFNNAIAHLVFDLSLFILFTYLGIRIMRPKKKGKKR